MKLYKQSNGMVWAFEADGSQDDLITADMLPMTTAEVATHTAPRPLPPPTPKQFTSLEFLDLFTDAEQLAAASAAMASAQVKLWYDRMLAASFVSLSDPRTSAGLQALVTESLITQARMDAILVAMG